ncbi:hypothetical protein [Streptomyces virginiae]|uniref:hypothetical protein n=1 Tax=Streptomyces virginiae TaxID=1961 RepID=UPI0036C1184B
MPDHPHGPPGDTPEGDENDAESRSTVTGRRPRRPTGPRPLVPARALALALALVAGCTTGHEVPAASPLARAPTATTRPGTPSPSAPDLSLAQQFDMGLPGADPVRCGDELALLTRGRPADRPMAWVSSGRDERQSGDAVTFALGGRSALCLYGFAQGRPITVTIAAGGRTYTTPVTSVAALSSGNPSKEELFNGRGLEVEDLGGGFLRSGHWTFLPPDPAREAVAAAGRLTLTASAGGTRATGGIPLRRTRGAETVEGWERGHRLAVFGFPAGARVPIGIYRLTRTEASARAVLVRKVGQVVMPRTGLAVLTIPQDVFRLVTEAPPQEEASYCLSVPGIDRCVT